MTDPGLDRRTLLKRGALLFLGASLPLPLSACGTTSPPVRTRKAFELIYASTVEGGFVPSNPPIGDFARLITERAKEKDVAVAVHTEKLRQSLDEAVERTEFDPSTNERPRKYTVIAISDPGLPIDRTVVAATVDGVQLVGFLYRVPHAAAQINVDPARMGRMLGEDLLTWAANQGNSEMLLVEPPSPPGDEPFKATAPLSAAAFRSTLAAATESPRVAATISASDGKSTQQALRSALAKYPKVRSVVCFADADAVVAAQVLAAAYPGEIDSLYVSGRGSPAVSSIAVLHAIGGCLRTIVAAAPSALADALVDLPTELLDGADPEDIEVPSILLKPHSNQLRSYARDYAPGGDRYQPSESALPFVLNRPRE